MKKIISLILVIVLALGVLGGCTKKKEKPVGAEPTKENSEAVEVVKPTSKDIIISHNLSGKLTGIEDVVIMSEVPNVKVESLKVKLGDKVSKGDILFSLDNEDIINQVEIAQAGYNSAVKNLESTKEKIENAKVNFERMKKLYEEGAISKQQYEEAKLGASETTLEALKATVDKAKVGLDQARLTLEKAVVKAPISGYVADLNIAENEFPPAGQHAMRIVNTDRLKVEVGVSEQIINKIYKDQKVDIKVKVATDEVFEGIVTAVSPVPDTRTQVYPIEIEIENKDNLLKPGMFAEIIFDIEKKENVLAIPSDAIKEKNEKTYVYVVENDIAKEKTIKTGMDNGKYVEIIDGLDENSRVILKGQDYVEDGEKVKVVRGEK